MDYINQYKLVCKCFTCNKIGHLTKNCELKSKHCPTICGGAYSVAYKGCPSYKSAMIKSIYIQQSISYAQAVGSRAAKKTLRHLKQTSSLTSNNL